jgi:guanosine-3',5'-bis(diphosphate) 3'-pyrophosphohydrolase
MLVGNDTTRKRFDKLVSLAQHEGKFTVSDVQLIQAAHGLALVGHFGQSRQTQEPFIQHPERACIIALEAKLWDVDLIVALLLHDVREDAPFRIDRSLMPRVRAVVNERVELALMRLSRFWPDEVDPARRKKTNEEYYAEMGDDVLVWKAKCCDRQDNFNTCELWLPEQLLCYIQETETFILPRAFEFVPVIGHQLQARIAELRRSIERGAPVRRHTPSGRSYVPRSFIQGVPELDPAVDGSKTQK